MLCWLVGAAMGAQGTIVVEPEQGSLRGVLVGSERPGFSGRGYIAGLDQDGDAAEVRFQGRRGVFQLAVRYCSPGQPKGFDLRVNGVGLSGMLPATGAGWVTRVVGRVELLPGANALRIEKGWGWYDLDRVEFRPAPPPRPPRRVPAKPCDPEATPEARALLAYLAGQYGKRTLTGQVGDADESYVRRVAGRSSAVRAGDLMDYSPSRLRYGANPGRHTEAMIARARTGAVVTMLWHWNAPSGLLDKEETAPDGSKRDLRWYRGFYTEATTFDVAKAMQDPASEERRLLLRDIDAIAAELRKFERARVPVLWRPLHEADGGWFWWGAKGPEPFKRLWRLLHQRLTRRHGLHNLLWVLTVSDPAWYPGDDVVDVIGVDAYPPTVGDALTGQWDELISRFDGRKLLALTEFGGVPDLDRMHRLGVRWSYFVSWQGELGPSRSGDATVRRVYGSPHAVNLEDLPKRPARGF
ncbi:MAG: glycosyl hydrolase [Fimbriimonadales bacterium]|nr:glycosyl hydrolase [Fimbriimonadales bacterium]